MKIIGVSKSELKLYADYQYTQHLNFPDSTSVSKIGLSEGSAIHVSNKAPSSSSSMTNTTNSTNTKQNEVKKDIQKPSEPWPSEKKKEEKNIVKSELEKEREKLGLTAKCNHPSTSKCLHCMQTPNYKGNIKYNCNHGENAKCPNCLGKDQIEDIKHISFDEYMNAKMQKCKGMHEPQNKCNNCMPPLELSYKMKKGCTFHPPFPLGMCVKCLPPSVVLGRQPYRHVDFVSFMNIEEVNSFVSCWQRDMCLKQRMAYLFGYFAEDHNYPNGIRAVVEAIYEPPQIGDAHGVESLHDPDAEIVDKVAAGLTLEFVGWMFTTIDTDKETFMPSYDIKKAAEFQEKFKLKHPTGYYVSKFVTVMVKPKDDGNVELECCMISDTFQALVRDNVIGQCVDKHIIPKRKTEKNEILPDIFQESKKVDCFDPAFAIVNVSKYLFIFNSLLMELLLIRRDSIS